MRIFPLYTGKKHILNYQFTNGRQCISASGQAGWNGNELSQEIYPHVSVALHSTVGFLPFLFV
jgi:hypothetical protein